MKNNNKYNNYHGARGIAVKYEIIIIDVCIYNININNNTPAVVDIIYIMNPSYSHI